MGALGIRLTKGNDREKGILMKISPDPAFLAIFPGHLDDYHILNLLSWNENCITLAVAKYIFIPLKMLMRCHFLSLEIFEK